MAASHSNCIPILKSHRMHLERKYNPKYFVRAEIVLTMFPNTQVYRALIFPSPAYTVICISVGRQHPAELGSISSEHCHLSALLLYARQWMAKLVVLK